MHGGWFVVIRIAKCSEVFISGEVPDYIRRCQKGAALIVGGQV